MLFVLPLERDAFAPCPRHPPIDERNVSPDVMHSVDKPRRRRILSSIITPSLEGFDPALGRGISWQFPRTGAVQGVPVGQYKDRRQSALPKVFQTHRDL